MTWIKFVPVIMDEEEKLWGADARYNDSHELRPEAEEYQENDLPTPPSRLTYISL